MTTSAPAPEGLMTIEEVAHCLRLSRAKVYAMAANGALPVLRMGRSVRIRRDRLEEWLDQQQAR